MTTPPPAETATSAQVPSAAALPPEVERRRQELERIGFSTFPTSQGVTGTRGRFYWDCMFTKLNTVAFVREVTPLNLETFETEKQKLMAEGAGLDDSALPNGFQKGNAVVAVFLSDQIDPALKQQVASARSTGGFAKFFFPVLVNTSTGEATWFEQTPFVGGLYYSKFRWLASRLARPGKSDLKEPVSVMGAALTAVTAFTFAAWLALMLLAF